MKYVYIFILAGLCWSCISVRADVTNNESTIPASDSKSLAEAGIRLVLEDQIKAWNRHDLEGFMKGYWNSPELKFYGPNGLTLGWDATLERYKKNYPTEAESGTLNFVLKDISQIESNTYWVIGEYHLKRSIGDADGVFIIIFKKIDEQWKIIADMSC